MSNSTNLKTIVYCIIVHLVFELTTMFKEFITKLGKGAVETFKFLCRLVLFPIIILAIILKSIKNVIVMFKSSGGASYYVMFVKNNIMKKE